MTKLADRLQPCSLTPQEERMWNETRVALLWQAPMFTHIFYEMMNCSTSSYIALFTKSPDIPIAATDGKSLILNPDGFFKYDLQERVFICAHEIAHNIFDHCGQGYRFSVAGHIGYADGSRLEYNSELMNVATDLVINDMLCEASIGKYNTDWLHDKALGTAADSAIDVYRKIFKRNGGKGGKGGGTGKGNGRFDQHLNPGAGDGKDPHAADSQRNAQEWRTAVEAGMASAKAQGKLPASMELAFGKLLNPEVPWNEKIEAFFARKIGSGAYDWRRPDRRLIVRDIYAPGRSGHGAGTVAVAIDTSGSIVADPTLLDRFMGELAGILEDVRPKRLMVMWIDADVHAVDEVEEPGDIATLKPKGGGGTDFRPAFDWLARENIEPDALVYLTDGYGTFPPKAPSYPTLWGNITPQLTNNGHYPFGEVVEVPVTVR